jgi:hypothetical protein
MVNDTGALSVYHRLSMGLRQHATLVCALCVAVGACSDPFAEVSGDPCAPLNRRSGVSACVVTTSSITVDGEAADWAGLPALRLEGSCEDDTCEAALPAVVQLALTGGGRWLAMRVGLEGGATPVTKDKRLRYAVELRTSADYAQPVVDRIVAGGGKSDYYRNDYRLSGTNHQVSWLPDGLELAVPRALLPFTSGVTVAVLVERESARRWRPLHGELSPAVVGCWDPADMVDPCRGGAR